MIKCKINKEKGRANVKAKGTVHETAVETLFIIKMFHEWMYKKNPEIAEQYRNKIIRAITDPQSPVWEVEDHG